MMENIYAEILGKLLFQTPGRERLLLIPAQMQDSPSTGPTGFGSLFRGCEDIRVLPDGEPFVDSVTSALKASQVSELFVLPPFMPRRLLSRGTQERYPRLNLEEIVLKTIVANVATGTVIGVFLPQTFFVNEPSRAFREELFSKNTAKAIVFHDCDHKLLGLPFHSAFRAATLIFEIGRSDPLLRMFKLTLGHGADEEEVLSDLDRLLRQRGGFCDNGYILQDSVPPASPITYDLYSPQFAARQASLNQIGTTITLAELVDVVRGFHLAGEAAKLRQMESGNGVALIEGRNIGSDGILHMEECQHRAELPSERQLRPCDICIRKIHSPKNPLVVACVQACDLPAASADSVIVLRPKATVSRDQLDVLNAFLRSHHAAEYIHARGIGPVLYSSVLMELRVPVPDEPLTVALRDLHRAKRQFADWANEATEATSSLFTVPSIVESRGEILSMGRLTRLRMDAAHRVSDFRHRVRSLFPHPIAFRWRAVESSHPDLEGYVTLLECVESTVCYLAVLAILHARSTLDTDLKAVEEIAKKLTSTNNGTALGDWVRIIREARDSKILRSVTAGAPFFEAAAFLRTDTEADAVLQRLVDRRNDQSHGRGPKGDEIAKEYWPSRADLEQFLQSCEFLTEYSLRFIETTRRDAIRKVTYYEYRDMMGDHPLVPVEKGETDLGELESDSLYVVDRSHKLHLARPWLNLRTCPVCGTRSTFHLDRFDKRQDTCLLKSLEHGHTLEDKSIAEAFRHVGML